MQARAIRVGDELCFRGERVRVLAKNQPLSLRRGRIISSALLVATERGAEMVIEPASCQSTWETHRLQRLEDEQAQSAREELMSLLGEHALLSNTYSRARPVRLELSLPLAQALRALLRAHPLLSGESALQQLLELAPERGEGEV